MDEWISVGWGGWLFGWMNVWVDGRMVRVGLVWMDGWIDKCVGGWKNGSVLVGVGWMVG